MKKLLYLLLAATALAACKKDDFLEPKTGALTEDNVFTDSTRTMNFLARIYEDQGFSFNKYRYFGNGGTEVSTDDAEYARNNVIQPPVILYNGTVSPLNVDQFAFWSLPYTNIRRVNLLLQQLPTTPLSAKLRRRVSAEARFLRAWYYENLMIAHGGVPLIGDQVYGLSDVIDLPRSSYAECVDYVVKELDECATILPGVGTQAEQDYGRITSGACLALKSRTLLYAASPLFNGGAETTDMALAKLAGYPTYSASNWQRAADAALAVLNLNQYSLPLDNATAPGYGFYASFLNRLNPEYIYFQNRPANRDMEGYYNPPTRGGNSYAYPSQNIVDAFPMKSGKAITDPTAGYDPKNPYVNRDPRFAYSIIYNGALYAGSGNGPQAPVYTYEGAGADAFTAANQSTGYYYRKMCDVNIANNGGTNTTRGWPLIRLAEIILNYAEALNELGRTEDAVQQVVRIRIRAGIDAGTNGRYGVAAGISQVDARDLIRNERRIELACEDHRWDDIRRWKIAMVTNNAFNKRMDPTRVGTTTPLVFNYQIVESTRRHNFRPEMYLMPIPDGEIRKVPKIVQNPGW